MERILNYAQSKFDKQDTEIQKLYRSNQTTSGYLANDYSELNKIRRSIKRIQTTIHSADNKKEVPKSKDFNINATEFIPIPNNMTQQADAFISNNGFGS